MRLKKQIAILALGAGFAACTPQPATNLIEDNMEFAPQFGTGRDTEPGAVQRLDKRILSGRTLVPLRIYPKQFLEKESPATY